MPNRARGMAAGFGLLTLNLAACNLARGAATGPATIPAQTTTLGPQVVENTPSQKITTRTEATATALTAAISTPTTGVPTIHTLHEISCLAGPAATFASLARLAPGIDLEIVAINSEGDYVLVNAPDGEGTLCWLWKHEVTVAGDPAQVPTTTPLPTPAPEIDFGLTFNGLQTCQGWIPEFMIVNLGNRTLNASVVSVVDDQAGKTIESALAGFARTSGCLPLEQRVPLQPGETGYTHAVSFDDDPRGHALRATIRVCASNRQGEVNCAEQSLDFVP